MDNTSTLAPIVVSVYHRLDCLRRCVESLLTNPESRDSHLYVVSDAASCPEHVEVIQRIRDYILSIKGFKSVRPVFHETNQGAGFSVRPTCRQLLDQYGEYIFMEDDVVAAPDYLHFLNEGLRFYRDDKRIHRICAFKYPFDIPADYNHDVYFLEAFSPWGNAIWKDRDRPEFYRRYDRYSEMREKYPELFKRLNAENPKYMAILKADSDGVVNAGDVRQEYYLLTTHHVCVFPRKSRAQNWGFDQRSDHCKYLSGEAIPNLASNQDASIKFESFEEVGGVSEAINKNFLDAYRPKSLMHRFLSNLKWFGFRRTFTFYWDRFLQKMAR